MIKYTKIILCVFFLIFLGTGCSNTDKSVDSSPESDTNASDLASTCGNGLVEQDEECDDGNAVSESCEYGLLECIVCQSDCTQGSGETSYCGDGIINGPEVCDDGLAISDFSPTESCAFECSVELTEVDCAGYYVHPTDGPIHTVDTCGTCDEFSYNDCSIVDNGDGTNLELTTGLTWMKCSQGMTFNFSTNTCEGNYSVFQYCSNQTGCVNGITDELIGLSTTSPVWETCRSLSYAGFSNWRVPTLAELEVIAEDYSGSASQVSTTMFPNIPLTNHWSSDAHAVGVGHSYGYSLDLNTGLRESSTWWNEYPVLCVRDDNEEVSCTDSCYDYDEATTSTGPNTCSNDCHCDGARTCSELGYCQGFAGECGQPPLSCTDPCWEVEEPGHCTNDCECDGARTCHSSFLVCIGDAGVCEN